uniref:Uncharacterized protein n=1 Tax=Rhizophora mucronata TaxID=61149 RepID=A0A2P2QFQ8_RHIMU
MCTMRVGSIPMVLLIFGKKCKTNLQVNETDNNPQSQKTKPNK